MPEFFDQLETRALEQREREQFERLPGVLKNAISAPGWRAQLGNIDSAQITSPEKLARLPVLRKSDLLQRQKETPPFGGFAVITSGKAKRLLMSPGPIFEPQGWAEDYYGAARALFAAGFHAGDVVHNSFAYHLTPGGFIMESAAHKLGCGVVPGGIGNTEQQLDAIAHYRPSGYTGTPDFLKVLLDTAQKAGKDASSLKRALVSGAALPASLREELRGRGVAVSQCYAIAEVGVIAYESEGCEGLIVNEHLMIEIVRPGTGEPVAEGEVGEVVVTSFNPDYPMIRLATGDLSAILTGTSPCGRTNMRIKGWMGRADQTTKVKGMFVRPEQVAEISKRHPELGRLRLVVSRENEQDAMVLRAEAQTSDAGLASQVEESLQAVTKIRGKAEIVPPGSLPNDGKVIADERS